MIQPLLYYSQDVDNPQIFTTLFIKDDSDAPDETGPTGNSMGLLERATYIELLKTLDLQGKL